MTGWLAVLVGCGARVAAPLPTDEDLLVQAAIEQDLVQDPEVRAALVKAVLRERVFAPVRDVPVSRAELESWWATHGHELAVPEKRLARWLFVDRTHADAEALVARLHTELVADPEAFATLAETHSDAPSRSRGGDQGYVGRDDQELPAEVVEVVFRTEPGQVSDVFETAAGYHLVRVSRRRDAVERSLDQLAETVRAKVRAERYEAAKAAYLAALRTGSGR